MIGLPIAFAFGAGLAALVSPCGFAMLPAYVSYYLGAREEGFESTPVAARLARAVSIGATATVAFVALFGSFGLLWGLVGQAIRTVIPGAAMVVGIGLAVLGLYMLVRGKGFLLPTFGASWGTGSRGYLSVLLFGFAYALATLSCTFPIFLTVMGNALTVAGVRGVVLQFMVYGLGMGAGLMAVTLGAAAFKNTVATLLRRALPYMERVSAVVLVFAGGYIAYYWYTHWFAFNAQL